jgi:hypothetical protein
LPDIAASDLIPRVERAASRRGRALFLDDQEAFVPKSDVLDVGILMARRDDEVHRHSAASKFAAPKRTRLRGREVECG